MAWSRSRCRKGVFLDTRQQRVAKNEALFREVNERIREINEGMGYGEEADFICECGHEDCAKPVTLRIEEYETVRAHPTRFAIIPGHEEMDVERVVERNERFSVVEKYPGAPSAIAVDSDPRS